MLMLISALAGALVVSGNTETFLSRNHQAAAQAEAAAEAGLNHGMQIVAARLAAWQTNGFGSAGAAASALLLGPDGLSGTTATNADNGRLDNLGIPAAGLTLAGVLNSRYEVRVMDEDDPDRGTVPSNVAVAPVSENNVALVDANSKIVIRSIGYARDNTVVTLEAIIGPTNAPGIVSNGDITIGGNFSVSGTSGGVHANGDLDISGSADIDQNATASGNANCGGNVDGYCGGSQPTIQIPEVRASDYRGQADYILTSDGRVLSKHPVTGVETEVCAGGACTAAYGWSYGGGKWSNNSSANGTYYVEGDVGLGSDMTATLFVEGSVDVSANSQFTPNEPGLFMVIDGDLEMTGGSDMAVGFEGAILVHEQVRLRGNTTIRGQLLIENAENNHSLVDANDFRGTADVIYNGSLTFAGFSMSSWREVR
jgi:hypothetical protein